MTRDDVSNACVHVASNGTYRMTCGDDLVTGAYSTLGYTAPAYPANHPLAGAGTPGTTPLMEKKSSSGHVWNSNYHDLASIALPASPPTVTKGMQITWCIAGNSSVPVVLVKAWAGGLPGGQASEG